eukprot:358684-Chlamydomonas_euryale.AAC.3
MRSSPEAQQSLLRNCLPHTHRRPSFPTASSNLIVEAGRFDPDGQLTPQSTHPGVNRPVAVT